MQHRAVAIMALVSLMTVINPDGVFFVGVPAFHGQKLPEALAWHSERFDCNFAAFHQVYGPAPQPELAVILPAAGQPNIKYSTRTSEGNKSVTNGNYLKRDLLILTLLLGVLFGFKLGDRALWNPVEGHYSEIAREMVVSKDYLTPWLAGMKYLEKPPLFYWLQSAAIILFGLNEWSLRLWPAVFGTIGCLAVYFAGSRLFDRRVGLISSAVLATSALWYAMGHIINLDMAVSTLITCALLSFLVASVEKTSYKRRFAMWAFFVFSALATLTKGLIGIVIPAMVIGTWILILDERNILTTLYLPSGVSLFLLIAAPWHVLISRANPDFLRSYFFDEHFQRYLIKPEGPFEQPWAYIPILLLGMFPWTVFVLQSLRHNLRFPWRQRHQHKEVIFLALWAGLVFLFFSASNYKGTPYILPMLPSLAILIARYIAAAWEWPRVSGVQSGSFALLVVLSLLVFAGLAGPQDYLERYSNWPSLEVHMRKARLQLLCRNTGNYQL